MLRDAAHGPTAPQNFPSTIPGIANYKGSQKGGDVKDSVASLEPGEPV